MSELNKILDYINNFETKNIEMIFLTTIGRSGSNLVHSLLDNHYEILTIPTLFPYYFDFIDNIKDFESIEDLVNYLLYKSSFAIKWYSSLIKDNRVELSEVLKEILSNLGELNRKNLILAIHFAYAYYFNVDLETVKVIVLHHHYPLSPYARDAKEMYANYGFKPVISPECNLYLDSALNDFPNAKIINCIRNPYDLFASTINNIRRVNTVRKSHYFLNSFYGLLFYYYECLNQKDLLGEKYYIIKFEDIHKNSELTMKNLSAFLGVNYNNTLLDSTFYGVPWLGNNPDKPMSGTNPEMVNDNWKKSLDIKFIELINNIFYRIQNRFPYKLNYLSKASQRGNIFKLTPQEREFLKLDIINEGLSEQKVIYNFIASYIRLRNCILKKIICA